MTSDVLVIGGGLAGLATATLLARGGLTVTLLEKSSGLGGRARTRTRDGFAWNLGPHALYGAGAAVSVLAELGVPWSGGRPPGTGRAVYGDTAWELPASPLTMLQTRLFGWRHRWQAMRSFARLGGIDPTTLDDVPFAAWLEAQRLDGVARDAFEAFGRLTTYANDTRMSAGLVVRQLQLGSAGVYYLHGGWQTLVDGLAERATAAGVRLVHGAAVQALTHSGQWTASWSEGEARARQVVVAGAPGLAAELLDSEAVRAWADATNPASASTLDLSLSDRPEDWPTLGLGIDCPLYLSVHGDWARLAPERGTVVHVAEYLAPGAAPDPARLEAFADRLLPGWRDRVVQRRTAHLVVTHDASLAGAGGPAARPGPQVPDRDGAWVVGDWVGPTGHLADASLASARHAARVMLALAGRKAA